MRDESLDATIARLRRIGRDDAHSEVKECAHGLSKDVWESVSAFANTEGGELILGLSERDGFVPVTDFAIDRVCDQFVSGIGDGGVPGLLTNAPTYQVRRVEVDDSVVLVVRIDELEASQKPCYITARGIQGGSFKRLDDKDVRLTPNELYALQSATVVDLSDRALVEGATPSDLDPAVCEAVFARARLLTPRSLRGTSSDAERLVRLNFTDPQGRIMRAGLLVGGVYPQQFFPKLHVDVAVHPGTTKGSGGSLRFSDRTVCEGTISEMIEDAVGAVAKNLRRRSVIDGIGRADELEIPESVLREAITNALIHRSYNGRFDGESVAVDVFDDRVEVTNPGGLWGKSREDLADGRSCCRNATIMRLMSLAPLPGGGSPAEGNGSGIPLMVREMANRGLEPPEFRPAMDHFRVILRRPQTDGGRGRAAHGGAHAGEALVMSILGKSGEMSVRELAERSGMSVSQVRRRLNELIAKGRVEATAPTTSRNRRYRLVG